MNSFAYRMIQLALTRPKLHIALGRDGWCIYYDRASKRLLYSTKFRDIREFINHVVKVL